MTKKELLEQLKHLPDDALIGYINFANGSLREVNEVFQTKGTANQEYMEYDEKPISGHNKFILLD